MVIKLKSKYIISQGITLKLIDNNTIDEVYIDNNTYKYFTGKMVVSLNWMKVLIQLR